MRKNMMLWMAVSADKLELPIMVEDSASKLAKALNTSRSNIISRKCKGGSGRSIGYRIVSVRV